MRSWHTPAVCALTAAPLREKERERDCGEHWENPIYTYTHTGNTSHSYQCPARIHSWSFCYCSLLNKDCILNRPIQLSAFLDWNKSGQRREEAGRWWKRGPDGLYDGQIGGCVFACCSSVCLGRHRAAKLLKAHGVLPPAPVLKTAPSAWTPKSFPRAFLQESSLCKYSKYLFDFFKVRYVCCHLPIKHFLSNMNDLRIRRHLNWHLFHLSSGLVVSFLENFDVKCNSLT